MKIYGVDEYDIGHDFNVHISSSRVNPVAVPDGSLYPPIASAAGCALLGGGLIYAVALVVRRRRPKVQAADLRAGAS